MGVPEMVLILEREIRELEQNIEHEMESQRYFYEDEKVKQDFVEWVTGHVDIQGKNTVFECFAKIYVKKEMLRQLRKTA